MSVFSPQPLPDVRGQKEGLLAQLMQQHQQAALRFAGQGAGLGLNNPLRAVAPFHQPKFGLPNSPQNQSSYPPVLFGPTVVRLRSAGG